MANTISESLLAKFIRYDGVAVFADRTAFLKPDPWPLFVRYEGGKVTFVPRDRFYFADPEGPSACLWIVPGSLQERHRLL